MSLNAEKFRLKSDQIINRAAELLEIHRCSLSRCGRGHAEAGWVDEVGCGKVRASPHPKSLRTAKRQSPGMGEEDDLPVAGNQQAQFVMIYAVTRSCGGWRVEVVRLAGYRKDELFAAEGRGDEAFGRTGAFGGVLGREQLKGGLNFWPPLFSRLAPAQLFSYAFVYRVYWYDLLLASTILHLTMLHPGL